jgi:hypothetical protein
MRLVDRAPAPPVAVGIAFSCALIALYACTALVFGEPLAGDRVPGGLSEALLGFATAALVAGYALAAGYTINAGNGRALEELRPHLHGPAALREPLTLARSRLYGAAGVLAGLLFILAIDDEAWAVLTGARVTSDGLFSIVLVPLPFWLLSRAAYFTLGGLSSIARLVGESLDFDLLDPTALAPLGRMALRGAVLWIGAAALGSLSIVLTGGSAPEWIAVLFLLAVAAASFLLPVRGVHRRIRERKASELVRTRAELRRDRETVASRAAGADEAAARLPGLLAWEARIEAVREWPFDTPTLMRFALYLLIPLGSWLGGALVERSIDVMLD